MQLIILLTPNIKLHNRHEKKWMIYFERLLFLLLFPFQYLADIEEHLGVTIQQVDKEMKVPVDEFDGKVVYGEKRGNTGESLHEEKKSI